MSKKATLKLILVDLFFMVVLIIATHLCSMPKGYILSAWIDENYLARLIGRAIVTDNVAMYVVPVLSVFFAWALSKVYGSKEPRMRTGTINAFLFSICGVVIYAIVFITASEIYLMPFDFFPSLLTLSFLPLLILFLFRASK